MKSTQIPVLPAQSFVFPILRPLITIIKCLKAMTHFDGNNPPVVLRRECLSSAGYLEKILETLCQKAGIEDQELVPINAALRNRALWEKSPVDFSLFNSFLEILEAFCAKHKSAMGTAYRQDKDYFNKLYKESVLKRKILVIHSPKDSPEAVLKTLISGCYCEAEALPANKAKEKSVKHHVSLFLSTDTREATGFLPRSDKMGVSIFLSSLGKEIPVTNMELCRIVNQAGKSGIKFISQPFVTMKVLPAIEEAYVRHLEELDRTIASQEAAIAEEEEALFRGMDEAVLYAELVVKSAWEKTAGHSLEQSLTDIS